MKILSCLMKNCRQPSRQIGKIIGISGNTVNARIKKLQKSQIIEGYAIKIDPPTLGYGIFYIAVSGNGITDQLKQIRLVGDLFFTVPCVGGVTVCGIVVKEDLKKKIELAKKIISGVKILTVVEADTSNINSELTRTDLEIIDKMLDNPRKKIEDIARETKLSTKTVARSIEKLHGNESVQFTTMYDPLKLGNYIPYAVIVWVNKSMKKIKNTMDAQFGDEYMQIPFLTQDQIVVFLYGDSIFEMDKTTQKIRTVPGVSSTEVFIPKKIMFPNQWIKNAINHAKKSPALHLAYQIN